MTEEQEKVKGCPDCGGLLKGVYAEANYGRVLLLDQCPACGGVWFDRWELYFLKESSLERLGRFDSASFDAMTSSVGSNTCPVCSEKLVEFTDPMLPPDTAIRRCPGCSGLWLNTASLKSYGRRRKKIGPPASAVEPSDAPAVVTPKGSRKEINAATLLAPETPEAASLDAAPIEPKEFAVDLGFLAVQALLRLVFKI